MFFFVEKPICIFVVHVVAFKDFFCSVIYMVVQDSQKEVLFIYSICGLYSCLKHSQFEYVAGTFVKCQIM